LSVARLPIVAADSLSIAVVAVDDLASVAVSDDPPSVAWADTLLPLVAVTDTLPSTVHSVAQSLPSSSSDSSPVSDIPR